MELLLNKYRSAQYLNHPPRPESLPEEERLRRECWFLLTAWVSHPRFRERATVLTILKNIKDDVTDTLGATIDRQTVYVAAKVWEDRGWCTFDRTHRNKNLRNVSPTNTSHESRVCLIDLTHLVRISVQDDPTLSDPSKMVGKSLMMIAKETGCPVRIVKLVLEELVSGGAYEIKTGRTKGHGTQRLLKPVKQQ